MADLKKTKAEAGRKGGKTTLKRYGKRHFKRLGRWGAHVMHLKYRLDPFGLNDFVLVERATNKPRARLSGLPLEE